MELARATFGPGDVVQYSLLVLGVNSWLAFTDMLTAARVFESMSVLQHTGSDLMSLSWTLVTIGSLLGIGLSIFGLMSKHYGIIFWMMVPCALQIGAASAVGLLPEERMNEKFNAHSLAKKHWNLFAVTMVLTAVSIGVAAMQLIDEVEQNMLLCFGLCALIFLIVTGSIYVLMERRTALVLIFLLIERVLNVNVKQAKTYWFTEDQQCVPNGPHFDYVFFSVVTFGVSLFCQLIGIWIFQHYLSRSKVRTVFLVALLTKILAKATDVWIILRWNIKMGIDDRSAYVFSEGVIEGIAFIFTYMPSAAVLSKIVEKDVETTIYTLLAGTVNLGNAMGITLGSAAMTFVGIHTDLIFGECNFHGLIPLLVISGMVLPSLAIPFIYLFVPDWTMHDDKNSSIDESLKAEQVERDEKN
jgi:hypothetical protein